MAKQKRSTLQGIDIQKSIDSIRAQLEADNTITPTLRASIELLIMVVSLLCNRLGLNSQNSHKSPAADPNRAKKTRACAGRKPGAQPGHVGKCLQPFNDPDEIEVLSIDRRTLPDGRYQSDGYESRQVA